jgi:hypothetical protein
MHKNRASSPNRDRRLASIKLSENFIEAHLLLIKIDGIASRSSAEKDD